MNSRDLEAIYVSAEADEADDFTRKRGKARCPKTSTLGNNIERTYTLLVLFEQRKYQQWVTIC